MYFSFLYKNPFIKDMVRNGDGDEVWFGCQMRPNISRENTRTKQLFLPVLVEKYYLRLHILIFQLRKIISSTEFYLINSQTILVLTNHVQELPTHVQRARQDGQDC